MRVIDYFQFIDECSGMINEEGFETFNDLLNTGLTKDDLINLVVEFTSIVSKSDLTVDELANPFNDLIKEAPSHLKLVH